MTSQPGAPRETPRSSARIFGAALLAAGIVSAVLAISGAAPVAINSPEQWADPREVLNVFSGMFLGYAAALAPLALLIAAVLSLVLRGRAEDPALLALPWVTGLLLAAVSLADATVYPDAAFVSSLRDHASGLILGLLAALGCATLVAAVLRSPLRTAAGAIIGTGLLAGVGALVVIVWLRGLKPGGPLLLAGCALAGIAGAAALAAAAAFVPRLSPARRKVLHAGLGAAFALLVAVPMTLARQAPGSRETGLREGYDPPVQSAAAPEAPNILLVSIDTLRPDRLSCYGNSRRTSPAIDEVAREGVLFRDAFSTSSWTLPAHASMLTGLFTEAHGADRARQQSGNRLIDPLAPGVRTLAEILGENGWRTAGFVSNPMVSSVFGIDRGFGEYHDRIDRLGRFLSFRDSLYWRAMMTLGLWHPSDFDGEVKVDEFLPSILSWLDDHASERFFLFAHFMEPHYIYEPPEQYRIGPSGSPVPVNRDIEPLITGRYELPPSGLDDLRILYDGEIAWLDSRLGELFRRLDRLGLSDRTLVIITSDHGESLGEHGLYTHGSSLHEEQVRVPLILRMPGRLPAGLVVRNGMASHVDLLPTILDLAGQRPAAGAQGLSLRPLWEGGDTAPFQSVFAELRADIGWKKINPRLGGGILMIRTPDWKLLLPDGMRPELYDLAADPAENRNVSGDDPARTRDLSARLAAWNAKGIAAREGAPETGTPLDPTTIEQLRTLGYVAP